MNNTTNNKAAPRNGTASTTRSNFTNNLKSRIWRLTYSVEEARQHYADTRQLWKQAAACIALYFLRMVA